MKRAIAYILSLLALLGLAACTSMEQPRESGIPDHCIELTIGNVGPALQTKSIGHSRGDDVYNENLVLSVDCFFYPDGGTDQNAVFTALGRGAEPVTEGDSTIYKVKIFFTDGDAQRIFGSTENGTGKVYVICNAPLSYGNSTSVSALKELVIENDFSAQTVQGSFVMPAEEPGTVTLSTVGETRSASGRVHVKRSAAKMQLFLRIPETFLDETNQEWEPVWEAGVQIMMENGVKKGKVDGHYTVQPSDYISTPYRLATQIDSLTLPEGKRQYNYTHVPFYSYPSAWTDLSDYAASYVFRIAWRIKGAGAYQWKSYQLSPNLVGQKFEPNHYYRTYVKISSLGGADKEHAVVIADCDYVIVDWMDHSTDAGQGLVPGDLTTYKYLVVDLTDITLNNEAAANFTYVTSAPLTSVKITKVEYYNNNNANPLQTQNVNVTVTADRQTVSTNAGSIVVNKETPGLLTISHSLDNMYSSIKVYATLTNGDGCTQDVIVVQNPSISLIRKTMAGNVFVNGYFARVNPAPPGTGWTSNTYRYSESNVYYYHCSSLWNGTNSRINNSTQTKNGRTTGTYGTIMGSTSGLDSSIDRNFYTTEISVSSFNSSNDYFIANNEEIHYRIGDPRVPSSTHYSGTESWTYYSKFYDYLYYNGSNTTELFAAWNDPENILITSQSVDARSIIAPKFLVSSALNANTGLTFEQAVKRGATYQEAGYPAGRWRLPTEAEIAFIVARQKEGSIPTLYATNSDYWSGSGRLVYIPTSATAAITFSNPASGTTKSCRFVYDLWYWGDEPAATNVYHPNGHNSTY